MGRKPSTRELAVWVNGTRVGTWRIPSRGEEEFQYDPTWIQADQARPLSLSLPISLDNTPLRGRVVHNYFDNLLPDSEPIRQRIQQRFHTRSQQAFDLLSAIGRDCVGAAQILPVAEAPGDIHQVDVEPLSEAQIEASLVQHTAVSTLHGLGDQDFRISIAGAQEKSAFTFHNGQWCKPLGATPTTHIFKLPLGRIGGIQADMTQSVENEWLCSRVVNAYGIPVAKTEMGQFGAQKVLIVERFDRELDVSHSYWLRLLQEDMCQASGFPPTEKYESEGGPGVLEICQLLQGSRTRDTDLENFFKAQILFWLLAAGDGHAKNFSIRILPQGRYQLTPLYDVISYFPIVGPGANQIPEQDITMAMSMRGKNKHYRRSEIRRRHFNQTAARCGVGKSAEHLISDLISKTPGVVEAVVGDLPNGFPSLVADKVLGGLQASVEALGAMEA